jgi:ribose transport system ATP-binding protein
LNIFSNLSVAENLYITDMPKIANLFVNMRAMKNEAREKLHQLGIDDVSPTSVVGSLPMGQRQLVEITKAIVGNANIIILDEPTTSLSPKEKSKLFQIMDDLKNVGKSIIFISHILEDVFLHCDEIVVLRDGKAIAQKPVKDLTFAEVVKMMVGRELNNIYPTVEKEIGDVVFEAKSISQEGRFENVSISLREGEIVGMFGLMGAGRTEFLRCLFGVDPIASGHVVFEGQAIEELKPEICAKMGMAFITENRREEGLLMTMTVSANTVLTSLNELSQQWFGFMSAKDEQSLTKAMVEELNVRTFNAEKQAVVNLSGGNQQKVVLSKWVTKKPKVFLLDEPTRGVDVGAKYEIYNIINNLAREKSAILMVSSEMDELMGMCDRIIVMCDNRITANFQKGEYDQEKIMFKAIGGTADE